MSDFYVTAAQSLSMAGTTFAFGFICGWIWANFYCGGAASQSNRTDKED